MNLHHAYKQLFGHTQGGTTNVNVQVGTLSYCEQGVSFDTTTTTNKQITSATVAHVSAAQVCCCVMDTIILLVNDTMNGTGHHFIS